MSEYVSNAAWLEPPGRADTIDEVADQFERPSGAAEFWAAVARRAASGGWAGQPYDRLSG